MGVAGVFLGTIISTVTTSLWVEPYVLYKYGFDEKVYKHLIMLIKYTIVGVVACILTYYICSFINNVSIIGVIIKLCICVLIPNLIYIIVFRKSEEYGYFKGLMFKVLKKIKNRG